MTEPTPSTPPDRCGFCGQPPKGSAMVNDGDEMVAVCHPDEAWAPDCYHLVTVWHYPLNARRLAAAEAENARLRAAAVVCESCGHPCSEHDYAALTDTCAVDAQNARLRAALEELVASLEDVLDAETTDNWENDYEVRDNLDTGLAQLAEVRLTNARAALAGGALPAEPELEQCATCGGAIGWIDCPTGGWWAHEHHPEDDHDADPAPRPTTEEPTDG